MAEISKEMILKGVGQIQTVDTNGKPLLLGHLTDIKITFTTETENIYGGDGLLAIDTLLKNKMIELTATNAKFNLNALATQFGGTVEELLSTAGGYATINSEIKTVTAGSVTIDYPTSVYAAEPNWFITYRDSGELLTKVDTLTDKGQYKVNSAVNGSITTTTIAFDTDDNGEVVVLSYRREADVDILKLMSNDYPLPVSIVHVSSPLKQKDGTLQRLETEIFSALAKGSMEINQARAAASVSAMSFEVMDPERADGMLASVKRYVG